MRLPYRVFALLCLASLAAACGSAVGGAPTAAPARTDTIRIDQSSTPDAGDIPRLLMAEALAAQGYKMEQVDIADDQAAMLALEDGTLDFLATDDIFAWNAIDQGAPIFTLMEETANTQMLLAANSIQECADLDGKRIAIRALVGAHTSMTYHYIEANCPGITPEYLVIPRFIERIAALQAGQVDALSHQVFGYLILDEEQAALVHPLVWYQDEFPGITHLSSYLRRGLAEEYPETAKDIVRAILQARRQLKDPQVLTDELINRLEFDPEQARLVAETYIARNIWDVNGTATLETVQANMDFFGEAAGVPAGLKAEDVADFSYLQAVQDEIGRQ